MNIQVTVENVSKISKKLTIKVPKEEVNRAFQKGLATLQKTANLKGFRPGQAPLSMIKQFYGEDLKHRVYHDLIEDSYSAALNKEKIHAVSQPSIESPKHQTGAGEHDHGISENEELQYTATVEVMPEIEPKGYTGLALTQATTDVTEDDMKKAIDQLLDSQAELKTTEDAAYKVKKHDFVDIEFKGGIVTDKGLDERPGMSGTRLLEIGSESFIEGFEDEVIGMKKGETKTFKITFPKDYFEKSIAGQKAEFTVTANEIKQKSVPTLTDDLAKTLGYESVTDLKSKAKDYLINEKKTDSERKLKSDLLQALIEKNTFDIPQGLVQAQTRALAQDVAQNLKQQGFNDQMIQDALTHEMENLKKRADNQVRASLILESIAKKETITVSEDEIKTEITKMAQNMRMTEDKVSEFYQGNPARKADLEFRLREEKAVQFILSKSKLKTK
jgi:trigger factor